MQILNNIEIIDKTLFLKKQKILIIADTHIGYEEVLNRQGVMIPRTNFKDLIKNLELIFKKTSKLNKIIINGDIKHKFGKILELEWRNTIKLIDFLKKYCKEVVLIKGNHDKVIEPIAEKKQVKIQESIVIDDKLIMHGDKIPDLSKYKKIKTIIIGHEHPSVSIKDNTRSERFKCFLVGKYKSKNLVVMPSFNVLTYGIDLVKEKSLGPFLKQNLNNFEVFVVSNEVFYFGKLKNL
jgi:uncharacterized protein